MALDVVGYYTALSTAAAPGGFTAIDVKKYPARDISRSPLCRAPLRIDLSDPNNWLKSDGNPPVSVPAATPWDATRQWMSYGPSYAISPLPPNNIPVQDYSFELKFCSCSQGTATVTNGNVKSDDGSSGNIGLTSLFSFPNGNFGTGFGGTPVTINSTVVPVVGQESFVIMVYNSGLQIGLSVVGTLILSDGYLGACRH